jgi:hypothetical protein
MNTLIEEAKQAHLEWLKRAEELVNNSLNESYAPVGHDECKFGKMINSKEFENVDKELMEEIDTIHFLLHDNYHQIHNLLGDNKNPSDEYIKSAKEYFEMLKPISSSLIESLEKLK